VACNEIYPLCGFTKKPRSLAFGTQVTSISAKIVTDWQSLAAEEQDLLLRLTALFQAGEEAVTLDLLPLIQVIAEEGRLEEEMYLTTFYLRKQNILIFHTDVDRGDWL